MVVPVRRRAGRTKGPDAEGLPVYARNDDLYANLGEFVFWAVSCVLMILYLIEHTGFEERSDIIIRCSTFDVGRWMFISFPRSSVGMHTLVPGYVRRAFPRRSVGTRK